MIAHIDVDAFFASVLVRKNPRLHGKPLLALGMGGGCVIAASYEAKAKGVKTGMRLTEALPLVPDAISIPSDFHEAARASREIEGILSLYCPRIEQMSIDEWFLDLHSLTGGLPEDLIHWATAMQSEIECKTSLTVSIGTGPTKTLAKMASEYRKPRGITVLDPSPLGGGVAGASRPGRGMRVDEFLQDRPAAAIPGIGRKRMIHTEANGWKTAFDFTQAPTDQLITLFGRPGAELKEELLGNPVYTLDDEPDPPKSVSRCRSFRPTSDRTLLWAHTLKHLEYVVAKMRRDGLACKGISVWLRRGANADYQHLGSNASLPQASDTLDAILPFVEQCFSKSYRLGVTYTQIGLGLWHLVPTGASQFSLFKKPEDTQRDESIQKSLDHLHQRYGRNSVTRASALSVKSGTKVTLDLSVYER